MPLLELQRQQLKNRFLDLFTSEHLLAHSAEVVVGGNHGVMEGFSEIWADQKLLQRVRCCGQIAQETTTTDVRDVSRKFGRPAS